MICKRSIGCIHVIVRLVVEFKLKLTARIVSSSGFVVDGDMGAVVRSKFLARVAIGGVTRAMTDRWNWRKQREKINDSMVCLPDLMVGLAGENKRCETTVFYH